VRFLLPMMIVALLAAASPAAAAKPDPFSPSAQTSSDPASLGTTGKRSFRAKSKRTVSKELKRLRSTGQIAPATYTTDISQYNAAKKTLKTLKGSRKTQLSAVIKNLDYIAAKGKLTPSRLPALFLTLETNRAWWSARSVPGNGARPVVPGSALVWQYYAGQGLQIQWLATFGQANGYFKSAQNTKLKALLDQAAALATQRAGGLAWEYLFKFGGGNPPWVSGLAQGTGVQAFARAAQKYADPAYRNYDAAAGARYYQTAKAALGVFKVAPPEGVRVNTAVGAHYLIYSYSKSLRVQNAFTQAVVGLHDYAQLIADPEGVQLYLQGDAQLRAETPSYDTGAWSKYSQARENNVSYHNLTIGFLKELCKRQSDDAAAAAVGGGLAPGGIPALDPTIYCTTEANYRAYLKTKPVIALKPSSLKKGKNGSIKFSLSKISRVSIDVRRGGATIYTKVITLGYGNRSVKFKPVKSGEAEVTLAATDLMGNKGSSSGTLTIRK
jgi:hypothetical protein